MNKQINKLNIKNNEITLNQLISGYVYDNTMTFNQIELSEDISEYVGDKMKEFILNKCRIGYKPYNSIRFKDFSYLTSIGLYNRLVYEIDTDTVQYVAGQDYPSEIATLKKYIIKG